jgi:hypothetical protein
MASSRDYAEFMIHSSELMPGGSPRFPTADSIEALYDTLEALFASACAAFTGCTMSEYFERFTAVGEGPPISPPQTTAQRSAAGVDAS